MHGIHCHPGRRSRSGIVFKTKRWKLTAVIPAQAGIHNYDVSRRGEQRRACVWTVSVYGSRVLLRSPGMTVLYSSCDPGSALRFVRDDSVVDWSNSQHLWARSCCCEPEGQSRVARWAARLDVVWGR
jgi:hypothetical protein